MAENVGVPTHLITGKAGSAHVTSSDVRKFNRCYSGYGDVYRLADPIDANWTVSITHETLRTIKIGYGSIMWNGMHIRNQEEQIIEFSDTVGWKFLCLHYVKNSSTGVESVEWIIIPDTEPTQRRNFKDNITNAYVTYYKWYYDGEANTQQTQVVGTFKTGKDRDVDIAALQAEGERLSEVVTLFTGNLRQDGTATLSEDYDKFAMLGFTTSSHAESVYWASTKIIASVVASGNWFDIAIPWIGQGNGYLVYRTDLYRLFFTTKRKIEARRYDNYILGGASSATISKGAVFPITKIYGMGRIG